MIDPRPASASEISENIGDVLAAIRRLIAEDEGQDKPAAARDALPFHSTMSRPGTPRLATATAPVAPQAATASKDDAAQGDDVADRDADEPANRDSLFGAVPRIAPRFSSAHSPASRPDWGRQASDEAPAQTPLKLDHPQGAAMADTAVGGQTTAAGTSFMTSTVRRLPTPMANPWAEIAPVRETAAPTTDTSTDDALASDGFSTPLDLSPMPKAAVEETVVSAVPAHLDTAGPAADEAPVAEPAPAAAVASLTPPVQDDAAPDAALAPMTGAEPVAKAATPANPKRLPHTGSMLRDLIREIIQDELRGDLGEVIAHEVDRAVRVQMLRARQIRQDRLPVAS